jgi:hypothetical protein
MQRSLFSAAILFLFCIFLAAPSFAAVAVPPSGLLAMTDSMTGSPAFLRIDCNRSSASFREVVAVQSVGIKPVEGYPIDLGNGCGCPSLSAPWRYEGNTCELQPGGETCTGVCSWVRTLPDGSQVGYPTECGTL